MFLRDLIEEIFFAIISISNSTKIIMIGISNNFFFVFKNSENLNNIFHLKGKREHQYINISA